MNVVAPVPASDRIYIRSGGWQSNITNTAIRVGQNTTNINGSIDGLYPTPDPQFPPGAVYRPCTGEDDPGPCGPFGDPFSIELYAGTFSMNLDVLPGASKFDIAAIGEAGGALITVDPAAGTYTGSITTLAAAARVGDYSAAIRPLWDYVTCDWKTAICLSFPGNIIPASRINPFWFRGVEMLPPADSAATGTLNTTATISGKLNGSHLSLSNQAFGGILQLGYGPIQTLTANFKLYVDGALVNSKGVSFPVWYRGIARSSDEP